MDYEYSYGIKRRQGVPPKEDSDLNWFNVTGDIDDFIFYDDDEKLHSER